MEGCEGRAIIFNQDVIDLVLDFSLPPNPLSRSPISTWLLSQRDNGPALGAHQCVFSRNEESPLCLFRENNMKVGSASRPVHTLIKHTVSNNSYGVLVQTLHPSPHSGRQNFVQLKWNPSAAVLAFVLVAQFCNLASVDTLYLKRIEKKKKQRNPFWNQSPFL